MNNKENDQNEEDLEGLTDNLGDLLDYDSPEMQKQMATMDYEDIEQEKNNQSEVFIEELPDSNKNIEDLISEKREKEQTAVAEENSEKEELHRKQLVESYEVEEEYILEREEVYKGIHDNLRNIEEGEVNEETIKKIAIKAKENTLITTIEQLTYAMSSSITRGVSNEETLEHIKSDSLYIQKEQQEFYKSTTRKLCQWKEKLENFPQEIIGDVYIKKLFEDFSFKVYSPNFNNLEKNLSGKDGYYNFLNIVKHLVNKEQRETIEDLIENVKEKDVDITIESFFKL